MKTDNIARLSQRATKSCLLRFSILLNNLIEQLVKHLATMILLRLFLYDILSTKKDSSKESVLMQFYVGVTDEYWFDLLKANECYEVNY